MRIEGAQFAVELKSRGVNDPHATLYLLTEDDESWFGGVDAFSAFWLDDLIEVLQSMKVTLENNYKKDPQGYGYTTVTK